MELTGPPPAPGFPLGSENNGFLWFRSAGPAHHPRVLRAQIGPEGSAEDEQPKEVMRILRASLVKIEKQDYFLCGFVLFYRNSTTFHIYSVFFFYTSDPHGQHK